MTTLYTMLPASWRRLMDTTTPPRSVSLLGDRHLIDLGLTRSHAGIAPFHAPVDVGNDRI